MANPERPHKIDHIGIAVHSLEKALPFYVNHLHMEVEGIEEVPSEQVKVAFLRVGESRIELLEPTTEQSPIKRFLDKRGEGIHHIALGVKQIEKRLKELQSSGLPLINNEAKVGAGGSKIAFLHPKASSGVLYELCESKGE